MQLRTRRRSLIRLLGTGLLCAPWARAVIAQGSGSGQAKKVLHVAFRTAETGFDPAMISDLYSLTITPHIFEALYNYDHLARPAKIKPLTAVGMPDVSADFRTWTVRVQPGIYFADDPAFKGRKREMVAQDHVYAIQRIADPANKSQLWSWVVTFGLVGLEELRQESIDKRKPFDYDRAIEGLRALDRHTIQFKLKDSRPRFITSIAGSDLLGAQAREVVDFYGDKIAEHPVGTGPFRLKQWRRGSLIVLEKSPDYRDVRYSAEPAADDAAGQAILARFKGRRLPMIDEVQVSIIAESQPFWLSFLNGQLDAIAGQTGAVPGEFISQAMPNGKLAPHLAKRGIQVQRQVNADTSMYYFNMEDPVVGGYSAEHIALRRAIGLAQDLDQYVRVLYRGQAIPAQSQVPPNTYGYDPAFKSENSEYSVARAKALLDMFGYLDRNGDGWREQPDGQPLVIVRSSQPEQLYREFDTLWKKSLDAIGIRTTFNIGQWPEQLKSARAGKLQLWSLGSSAADPDGQGAFQRLNGPQAGGQNLARFKNVEFDSIYDKMEAMPDGPERLELFRQAKLISIAYAPYKATVHRISTDMLYPWVVGYRRPVFWQEWWHMVDIDMSRKPVG
jgi:ABC-type transport system substrate-binding protein